MPILTPITSGESDLSVTRTELLWALANEMGWDHTVANWSTEETTNSGYVMKSALRNFYGAHPWSFLEPTRDFNLVTGEAVYDLPADFAALEKPIYFRGQWASMSPIAQGSLAKLNETGATDTATGVPRYYFVEPLPTTGEQIGQRYAIRFDIAPAADYTVRAQYRINPYNVTSTRPYPLGSVAASEALVASIISSAQRLKPGGGDPNKQVEFLRLLEIAKRDDIRKSPAIMGNTLSGGRHVRVPHPSSAVIRYNGNIVSG